MAVLILAKLFLNLSAKAASSFTWMSAPQSSNLLSWSDLGQR